MFSISITSSVLKYFNLSLNLTLENITPINLLWLLIILIGLSFIRKKLFSLINISLIKFFLVLNLKDKKSSKSKILHATTPIWVIPPLVKLNHKDPSLTGLNNPEHTATTLARAKDALSIKKEANMLYLVINKLDREQPLKGGTSRMSAFCYDIMDSEDKFYYNEKILWKNLYRNVIMKSSKIRSAELSMDSASSSGSSTPISIASDNSQTVFSNSINNLLSLL